MFTTEKTSCCHKERWIKNIYYSYGNGYRCRKNTGCKTKLLRTHKILIALLLMLLAVITCTALFSCKHTDTITYIDGWRIHSNVPVDTNGMSR